MYLTYDRYKELGGQIPQEQYPLYAARADAIITRMTHGRIRQENPVRACVQYAAFALAEAIHTDVHQGADGREIASVSNDGVSVAYVSGGLSGAAEQIQRYTSVARAYLEYETDANGVFLLYAGVDA